MLYPSIDVLMKTIDSKYTLVTVSAKRARQIQELKNPKILRPKSKKYVGVALEEINAGELKIKNVTK
jgi:DNA-directed RNA polymerase subunit omega